MTGESPTLAQKIDQLFCDIHPPGRGSYSYAEVAEGIVESGGPTISASYIWQLRTGQRDNPTKRHLEALSGFFGVEPAYFFDDARASEIAEDLKLLAAVRDSNVRSVALRSQGLSHETLATIRGFIDRARELEGLPDQPASQGPA